MFRVNFSKIFFNSFCDKYLFSAGYLTLIQITYGVSSALSKYSRISCCLTRSMTFYLHTFWALSNSALGIGLINFISWRTMAHLRTSPGFLLASNYFLQCGSSGGISDYPMKALIPLGIFASSCEATNSFIIYGDTMTPPEKGGPRKNLDPVISTHVFCDSCFFNHSLSNLFWQESTIKKPPKSKTSSLYLAICSSRDWLMPVFDP